MSTSKGFCARPGCRVAFAVHGRLATCAGYIDPTSSAGAAILRAEKKAAKGVRLAIVRTPAPIVDSRPRFLYRLPGGEAIKLIADHGDVPRQVITYQTKGGAIVNATLVLA